MLLLCIIHAEQIRRGKLSVKSPHYLWNACHVTFTGTVVLIWSTYISIFFPQWPPLFWLNESKCNFWNFEFWLDFFRPENVPSVRWDISRCPGQRFHRDPVQTCSQSTCRSWLLCITTCASLSTSMLCVSVCLSFLSTFRSGGSFVHYCLFCFVFLGVMFVLA